MSNEKIKSVVNVLAAIQGIITITIIILNSTDSVLKATKA